MPNLVGIGNSQAPTNAMLGGLAYQDSVGEIDIDKIKARTSDTAVDVFVYDTRKDSDGGAWRHRTQNTSWYNEGASATRGARKEFPAVAIIVTEAAQVTIYDGDDPNLPMWMVFNNTGSDIANVGILGRVQDANKVAKMLNGILFVGNANYFATYIPFISENVIDFIDSYSSVIGPVRFNGNIEQRNEGLGKKAIAGNKILAGSVNDVAMTVLPNAPIDASTGLPVPTIAVATNGGVSVIKNDGTVVSKTTNQLNSSTLASTYFHKNIDISGENAVVNYEYTYTGGYAQLMVVTLNDLTLLRRYGRGYSNTSSHPYFNSGTIHRHFPKQIYKNNHIFTREHSNNSDPAGSSNGILTIFEDQTSPSNGLVNRISSSYNTGWMHGDIKGAFLSDTSTTNITGSELVTNGDFASNNVTGWTERESGGSFTASGGQATLTYSSGVASWRQDITIVSGETYTLSFDIVSTTTSSIQFYYNHGSGGDLGVSLTGSAGKFSVTFVAASNSVRIFPRIFNSGNMVLDNISLRIAEEDRSVNDNGLQVFGTVPKQPVATGADLVSYGPFSTSNRLRQPYNSNLRFETNDFSVMFWMFNTGSNNHESLVGKDGREFAIDILDNTSYSRRFRIYVLNSSDSMIYFDSTNDPFLLNSWTHVCVNFTKGNTCSIYVNGVLNKTGTWSGTGDYDIDSTTAGLNIGCRNESGLIHPADYTKLSLIRISAGAPSADQVKKIYNDEKCLFHENAKCTLHGTSNNVKALAFDDTNGVLHVGTSSGRSDFRGLNRINNTTTAVTTAISASNGLVAEQ